MATTLNAREVYQVLKDIALEVRQITRLSPGDGGVVHVHVDGWTISLHNEGHELDLCTACTAADGRSADAQSWQRFGTDPVHLLSRWEHEQLQRLLSTADAHSVPT